MNRASYIVSGNLTRRRRAAAFNGRGWFAEIPKGAKWNRMTTGIHCKTEAHALAQYRRLQRGSRQIDRHGCGDKHAWKWDK